MEFGLSRIKFSKKDLAKGIKIPIGLTEELAEDIGIHIGDGSLYRHGEDGPYEFSYSGNIAEKEYMHHIIKLKRKLYNASKIRKYVYGNEFRVNFNSLAMATFYSNIIGLPIGKKKDIDVPDMVKNCENKKIIAAFLRGIIDTDFSLIARKKSSKGYLALEGASASKTLIVSLYKLFKKLGIKSRLELDKNQFQNKVNKFYKINKIIIGKQDSIIKCFRVIKPHNDKYLDKINKVGLWGFEPQTTACPRNERNVLI